MSFYKRAVLLYAKGLSASWTAQKLPPVWPCHCQLGRRGRLTALWGLRRRRRCRLARFAFSTHR